MLVDGICFGFFIEFQSFVIIKLRE